MSPVHLPERLQRGELQLRLWEPRDASAMAVCIGENLRWLAPFMPWVGEEPLRPERRLELITGWRGQFEAGMDAIYGIWLAASVAGGCGLGPSWRHRSADGGPRARWGSSPRFRSDCGGRGCRG